MRFVGSNKLLDTSAKFSTSSSVLTLPCLVLKSASVTSISTAITKSPPKISGGLCVLFSTGWVKLTSCERTCWAVVFDWKPCVIASILKWKAEKWESLWNRKNDIVIEIFWPKRNDEVIYIKSRLWYPALFSRQNMTRPASFQLKTWQDKCSNRMPQKHLQCIVSFKISLTFNK